MNDVWFDRFRTAAACLVAGCLVVSLMALPAWLWIELIRWAANSCG